MIFPTERAARRYAHRVNYKVSCVEYLKGEARVQCFDPSPKHNHSITLKVDPKA